MKKILMSLVLFTSLAAGVFAAGAKDSVTVEGKLAFTDSLPTIVSGGKTWVLPIGPFYQVAYENNIKANDTLKVEGYDAECPADFLIKNARMLFPSKVSVNGKALDLSKYEDSYGMGGGPGMMGGRGYGDSSFNGNGGRKGGGGMMGNRQFD